MAIRNPDDRVPALEGPAESRTIPRFSIHDAILAGRLAEGLGRDGWTVGWSRRDDGSWEASVGSPSMAVPAGASGLTRVSAITGAYLGAIRRVAGPGPTGARAPRPEARGETSEFFNMIKLFDLV